ncbi:MAG: hypothetical protein HY827_00360 [Actinobacteria bacterium]|nr:hypothetical protein [Actinomycetota bacterium]
MKTEFELFHLKQQMMGRPHGIDSDEALWGENRTRYYELVNAKWAKSGFPLLVNDEEGNPELTQARRQRLAEAELAHNKLIELWSDDATIEDGLRAVDDLQLSARKRVR